MQTIHLTHSMKVPGRVYLTVDGDNVSLRPSTVCINVNETKTAEGVMPFGTVIIDPEMVEVIDSETRKFLKHVKTLKRYVDHEFYDTVEVVKVLPRLVATFWSWCIPMYGSKHAVPYGVLTVKELDNPGFYKSCRTKGDLIHEKGPQYITYDRIKYEVVNEGTMWAPKFKLIPM